MKKKRTYGNWAGNPKGQSENKTRCVEEIWSRYISYQCSRKRGHGPNGEYCKQHAKMIEDRK